MAILHLAKGDHVLTKDGLPLMLETGDEREGPGGQTYPTRLDFRWKTEEGKVVMAIPHPKLIEVIDMTEGLPHWTRPLIHLFANLPYYVDLKGMKAKESGRAIFENMMQVFLGVGPPDKLEAKRERLAAVA